MKYVVLIALLITNLFITSSFGCTLAVKGISIFDETEYVFIGEVVGYTKPVESEKLGGAAYGLIVKVKESVYLPKTPKSYFEVFPIDLWADCSQGGVEIERLEKEFPIKTEIRIIAKEAEILTKDIADGNIRLEDRPEEIGDIAPNFDANKTTITSSVSVFDYKHFNDDSKAKITLPNFEIRKDLLRLKNVTSQKETNLILDRLFYAPPSANLDLYSLFKNYTSNEVEFKRYYETNMRATSPDTYKQYRVYQETLANLIKLGYQRKAAERAIGNALSEGVKISVPILLKRSLQLLAKG